MFKFGKKKSSALWKGIGVGAGLGAGLMFLLDPDRGRRRRALARDKAIHLAKSTEKIVGARSRDLGNRASGAASRIRSLIRGEAESAAADRQSVSTDDRETSARQTARKIRETESEEKSVRPA
jgi:gas vesicle protein